MALPQTAYELYRQESGHWTLIDRFGGREREAAFYAARTIEQRNPRALIRIVKSAFNPEKGIWDELVIHRSSELEKVEAKAAAETETEVDKWVVYQLTGGRWVDIRDFRNAGADLQNFISALKRNPPPHPIRIVCETRTTKGRPVDRKVTFESVPQNAADLPPMPGEFTLPHFSQKQQVATIEQSKVLGKFFFALVFSLIGGGVITGLTMMAASAMFAQGLAQADGFRFAMMLLFFGSAFLVYLGSAHSLGVSAGGLADSLTGLDPEEIRPKVRVLGPGASQLMVKQALPDLPPMEEEAPLPEGLPAEAEELAPWPDLEVGGAEAAAGAVEPAPAAPVAAVAAPPMTEAAPLEAAAGEEGKPPAPIDEITRELLQMLGEAISSLKESMTVRDAVSDRYLALLAAGGLRILLSQGELMDAALPDVLKALEFVTSRATDPVTLAVLRGRLDVPAYAEPMGQGATILLSGRGGADQFPDLQASFAEFRAACRDIVELRNNPMLAVLRDGHEAEIAEQIEIECRRRPNRLRRIGEDEYVPEGRLTFVWSDDLPALELLAATLNRRLGLHNVSGGYGIGVVRGDGIVLRGFLQGEIRDRAIDAARLSFGLAGIAVEKDVPPGAVLALNHDRIGLPPIMAEFSPV